MSTFSNNTTIKMNAAVSAASAAVSATLYTAPANGYAIVQGHIVSNSNLGNFNIAIGGLVVFRVSVSSGPNLWMSTSVVTSGATGAGWSFGPFHVGPGQAVTVSKPAGAGNSVSLQGVEYVNTP